MKKALLLITLTLSLTATYSQSVGIGTIAPNTSSMLDVSSTSKGFLAPRMMQSQRNLIASPAAGLLIYQTDNTPGYYFYNGTAWVQLASGGATNFWSALSNHIYNNNSGNVGIGTAFPTSKLAIQTPNNTDGFTHTSDGGIVLTERVGGISASIGTSSNHTFRLVANNLAIVNIDGLGNVGVGLTDQTYKMDISDRIRIRTGPNNSTAGIWFNKPDNSAAIAFMGVKDVDVAGIYGNNAGWQFRMNTNTGDVAIGNTNPVAGNKLTVLGNQYINGLIQTTGDAEIGGAAQVTGNLNVGGFIGVGGAPYIPLEVFTVVPFTKLDGWTYYNNGSFTPQELCIRAHGDIMATEFVAISDVRMKNVEGRSNSARDLETINALQVTDYTMKDKMMYGEKKFKKVIAQEVEKVYPQVVNRTVGFIPNVYAVTTKIEKTGTGYLLTFTKKHNLTHDAKKLQILIERDRKVCEVVSIPSENQVMIKCSDLKADKVFVYGEEINDFRNVDYEGLSTLNISATQELSKLIKNQQAAIDEQNIIIAELKKNNEDLKLRLEKLEALLLR